MKKYAGFRNGYVRVRIYGEQTERFLNLCRAREIRISDLRRESELSLTGCLQIRDFFRLAPIHRKTKVKIHILEKHGLPFFFYRSKKRKAFFLGLLLCAGLLLFLSGRLWEIDVEGNVRNSTPEILDFLEQKGIRHGMAKGRLSCSEIAAEIRKKYPDAFDGQDLKYLWETTNVVKFTDLYPGAKSICQEKYNGKKHRPSPASKARHGYRKNIRLQYRMLFGKSKYVHASVKKSA